MNMYQVNTDTRLPTNVASLLGSSFVLIEIVLIRANSISPQQPFSV